MFLSPLSILKAVLGLFEILIIIRILFSWIQVTQYTNSFTKFVYDVTEPILSRVKIVIPIGRYGGIDIGPLIIILVISFIKDRI